MRCLSDHPVFLLVFLHSHSRRLLLLFFSFPDLRILSHAFFVTRRSRSVVVVEDMVMAHLLSSRCFRKIGKLAGCFCTEVSAPTWVMHFLHSDLSCASLVSSSNFNVGESIVMLPGRLNCSCAFTASFTYLCPCSRNICPSHL